MFSTGRSANIELGIVTMRPSLVWSRVERMPISLTTPVKPATLIHSLRTNGWSVKIVTPPKTFDTVSLAAMARARPPMPRPASRAPTL